ncbi:hypothetical protein H5395_16770 [Paracoccus sp. MC1854]|uniref:hypothetical protein n=1 Tax=Paracoccus sp. MC1854 TaxID=2760306 RepID=UPI0015FFC205|nr:hypothetical protein [Paracoccus sp. MC1854]MBB1493127.1 hypothetical protein [Paracoccus sp. MC1854]
MTLQNRLSDLATRAATEDKALRTLINGNLPDLSALTTSSKTSLVAAINALQAEVAAAAQSGGAVINDGATTSSATWSSTKIGSEIAAAIAAVTNGAPGALDTLEELAAALGDDARSC